MAASRAAYAFLVCPGGTSAHRLARQQLSGLSWAKTKQCTGEMVKEKARFLPSKARAPPLFPVHAAHHRAEPSLYLVPLKHLKNDVNNSGEGLVAVCRRCLGRMLA